MGEGVKKKVLVTGANGFIGSWICKKLLENNYEVIALAGNKEKTKKLENLGVLEKIQLEEANIASFEDLNRVFEKHSPDYCVHLAALAAPVPPETKEDDFLEVNVKGTENVIEAFSKNRGAFFVLASTNHVYKQPSHKDPLKEDAETSREKSYPKSKALAEEKLNSAVKSGKVKGLILRFSHVFGGNDSNKKRLIVSTVTKILGGEKPTIFNGGKQMINFVYVKDVSEAVRLSLEKRDEINGLTMNICSGKSHSVVDAVRKIISLSGKRIEINFINNDNAESRFFYLDNSLAREKLGWLPSYSFENALKETIEWYKKNNI